MNNRLGIVGLAGLLAFAACKDEKPKAAPDVGDAGAIATSIDVVELGVRVPLLQSWRTVGFKNRPSDKAVTVGSARRLPGDRPFVAAPRLVVTVEETVMHDVEPVLRETLDELKSIGMRDGIDVLRTGLSTRPVRGATLGDVDMVYTIADAEKKKRTIVHRSIVALRTRADGSRGIVTVTATYLTADREMVGAEVQVMLDGVELFDPPRVDP